MAGNGSAATLEQWRQQQQQLLEEGLLLLNLTESMSAYTPQFASSAAFGIFVCIFDILLALVLLLLLVTRDQNRQPFIYRQVCGLVVCDLLFSALVDPLTVYIEREPWMLGQAVCTSWHFLDNLLPFIAFVSLLTTSVDRLTFALAPRHYHAVFQRPGWRLLLLLLPWAVGLVIMAPIWLLGSSHPAADVAGICAYSINNEANTTSAVLALFLPTLVLVVVTVLLLSTVVVGLPPWPEARGRAYVYSGLGKGLGRTSLARRHRGVVLGLCLCNFWTIAMQLPYGVLTYIEPGCSEPISCHSVVQMFQGLSWMRSLVVGARCITWLLSLRLPSACADSCRRALGEEGAGGLPQGEAELQVLTSSRRHVSGSSTTTYLPCSALSKEKAGGPGQLSVTTEAAPCRLSLSTDVPPSPSPVASSSSPAAVAR